MAQPERETLYNYRNRLDWVKKLGWRDKKLRQIPVHYEQTDKQPFISMTEVNPSGLSRLYVYKDEVPEDIWAALSNFIANLGGPSGFEKQGLEGTRVWDETIGRKMEQKGEQGGKT